MENWTGNLVIIWYSREGVQGPDTVLADHFGLGEITS
jgi:hypothetical protein